MLFTERIYFHNFFLCKRNKVNCNEDKTIKAIDRIQQQGSYVKCQNLYFYAKNLVLNPLDKNLNSVEQYLFKYT